MALWTLSVSCSRLLRALLKVECTCLLLHEYIDLWVSLEFLNLAMEMNKCGVEGGVIRITRAKEISLRHGQGRVSGSLLVAPSRLLVLRDISVNCDTSNPMSTEYKRLPRCGIDNCKQTLFYLETGRWFCKNGHMREVGALLSLLSFAGLVAGIVADGCVPGRAGVGRGR